MHVGVDEARAQDLAGCVDDLFCIGVWKAPDGGDAVARYCQITLVTGVTAAIDDGGATNQEIEHRMASLMGALVDTSV